MKISELPKEIREEALEYQRNEKFYDIYDRNTDSLINAFDWTATKEGENYWDGLHNKISVLDFKVFTEGEIKCDKPKQYQIGIDTFTRAEANLTKDEILAICKFNIDKYCWRKKDQDKEDFKKIIDYANWALKNL